MIENVELDLGKTATARLHTMQSGDTVSWPRQGPQTGLPHRAITQRTTSSCWLCGCCYAIRRATLVVEQIATRLDLDFVFFQRKQPGSPGGLAKNIEVAVASQQLTLIEFTKTRNKLPLTCQTSNASNSYKDVDVRPITHIRPLPSKCERLGQSLSTSLQGAVRR